MTAYTKEMEIEAPSVRPMPDGKFIFYLSQSSAHKLKLNGSLLFVISQTSDLVVWPFDVAHGVCVHVHMLHKVGFDWCVEMKVFNDVEKDRVKSISIHTHTK